MTFKALITAALTAAALVAWPTVGAQADTLRVATGTAQAPLRVPLNRAVVIESDAAFAELSIANPLIADIATLSERTIYVLGKTPGRTTLTLLGLDGRLITNVDVHVTPDVAELKERLSEFLPRETISVRTANNGIVMSGTVSSSQAIARAVSLAQPYIGEGGSFVNLMVVGGTQQVQLKVRFAEMSRSVTKELSASLGANGSILNNRIVGGLSQNQNTAQQARGTLTLSFGSGSVQFNSVIQALESKGVVRTLAEPNLTALSGKTANFLAGGEFPVPVLGENGQVAVSYRPFGVELSFLPTVIDGDIINLEMNASVSGIDTSSAVTISSGFTVNAFTRRQTSTTVELRDGQSFAIAGILEDDFRDNSGQVPWLGDIPVLGALFRSASYEREQSELVIIVTAHLVSPTVGEALALPTDRIRPPTEQELFLFGEVAAPANTDTTRASTRGPAPDNNLTGSYGYVLE